MMDFYLLTYISVCSKTSEHCIQLTKKICSSFSRKIPSHGKVAFYSWLSVHKNGICGLDEAYFNCLSFSA